MNEDGDEVGIGEGIISGIALGTICWGLIIVAWRWFA